MQEIGSKGHRDRCGRADAAQLTTDITAFSQISEPMLSLLYAYWDGKRGERRFPGRSDLDPIDIPSLLPSIFLVAVQRDPFDLVFRLAGGVLTACYGSINAGERLIELPGSATQELYEQSARAVRSGKPVLMSGALRTPVDAFQRADHLLLPLGETRNQVDMLIGGAIFRAYPVGERPDFGQARPKRPTPPRPVEVFSRYNRITGPDSLMKSKRSGGR